MRGTSGSARAKETRSVAARPGSAEPAGDTAPRQRVSLGRPPKLSREQILRHVLHLIESEPGQLPTLEHIVDDLDAVPSALYRHFRSRDDLMNALLALVISDLELRVHGGAEWTEQVKDWMRSIYRHLVRYPSLLPLLGDGAGQTSAAWLSATAQILRILERAGFSGRELALAVLFVAESTMGIVLQQGPRPLSGHIAAAFQGLGGVPASERGQLAQFLAEASTFDSEEFFEFVIDRTVSALIELGGRKEPRDDDSSV